MLLLELVGHREDLLIRGGRWVEPGQVVSARGCPQGDHCGAEVVCGTLCALDPVVPVEEGGQRAGVLRHKALFVSP
jgi:hypothetical protein